MSRFLSVNTAIQIHTVIQYRIFPSLLFICHRGHDGYQYFSEDADGQMLEKVSCLPHPDPNPNSNNNHNPEHLILNSKPNPDQGQGKGTYETLSLAFCVICLCRKDTR